MKGRNSKRVLSLILSVVLTLLSVWPSSVLAADEAATPGNGQTKLEQQQESAGDNSSAELSENYRGGVSPDESTDSNLNENSDNKSTPKVTENETNDSSTVNGDTANSNGASGSAAKDATGQNENGNAQADEQSLNDTLPMSLIESILGKDADGKELFYTTLLDSEDRIVDTTDPELEKDNHYKSKEEGGEAGTVDLKAKLKVRFRMAEILEHDGDSGVQENVLYYMTLPRELVPVKKDSAGKVLVDPENPVTFFQSGDIQCVGGIYSVPDQDPEQYQLQMQFSDVEDQINISGEFQYDVTVSDQLEEGTKCTVSYVPGGTLEFNITPKKEEPVEADESLTLTGQKNPDSTDKIDWTLTLTDKDMKMSAKRLKVRLGKGSVISAGPVSSKPSGNIGMSSVVITYQDGTTETLNYYQMNSSAYSLYRGEEGANPNPTMTDGSGDGKGILGTAYVDDSDYKSENTILASGYGGGRFLTDTLYIDMAALRSNGSSRGNNAGSSNPADIDLGICKYEFKFTSQVYDDYDISGNNYTATATMTDAQETTTLATATAGTSISYGALPSGKLDDTSSDEVNYFGIPSYIQTRYWIDNQTYTGNHYSLKFAPQRVYKGKDTFEAYNNSDAIYYTSNYGFSSAHYNLVGDSSAAFEQLDIGNANEWTYCGPLSYAQIQSNDTNDTQSLGYKLSADYDLVLKYQVQKVFENMDRNAYVEMYKSTEEVNGKTVYLFVDPDTRENAIYSVNNGWSRLASKTDASGNLGVNAESSCWKIHVFNAPAQSVSLSFKQSNGAAFADNVNVGGGATDTMVASYHVYGDTSDSGIGVDWDSYGFSRPAANVMTGRWLSEDTIFWEWTIDVENLQKNNSWYSSRAYIKVPGGQQLIAESPYLVQNPLADVDGAVVNMQQIQYYAGGTWNNFTGTRGTYRILGDLLTTNSNNPSRRLNDGYDEVYYADYGSIPTYDGRHVKIGFTTKVTEGYSVSALKCQAELVPMMGETTQFGSGGAPYYPFKIYAEGSIGMPTVYKNHNDSGHTEADADGVEHITDTWTIYGMTVGMQESMLSSPLLDTTYIGFYSGVWSLHDDMKYAYTEDEEGSKIDVNPGKYTSLKEMSVIASGPGMSAEIFKLSENDLREVVNETDHKKSFTGTVNGKTVKLTLTYQGNMYDGFDAEVSGLKDVDVFKINYTTDFNQKEFFDGVKASGGDTSHFYTAVLKNGAHRGSQSSTGYPSESETIKHRVVAALDINKAVAATPKKDEDQGGYSAQYQLDTQIGYTSSAYVDVEDFVLGYKESKDDTGYQESDADALKALVKSLKLSDLTIKATDVNDKVQQIYSGKEENGAWTGSETDAAWNVSFDYKPDTSHPGSLFKVRVTKADGSEISADYKFTVEYNMTVCMDESDTDFRDSGYYNGGGLLITNGGNAVRTMKALSSDIPDTQSVKSQAAEDEDLTLDADCGGGVTVSYLADKLVNKTVIPTSDSDVTKWL